MTHLEEIPLWLQMDLCRQPQAAQYLSLTSAFQVPIILCINRILKKLVTSQDSALAIAFYVQHSLS